MATNAPELQTGQGEKVDLLRLEYIPLSQVVLWEDNPKLHDVGGMAEAFREHGFKDPMKFEPELNDGKGGLGHGNGRGTTLNWLHVQGEPPPRGVYVRGDGEWAVPVLFGVDARSEAAAQAYAVAHNNLVLAGADFSAFDYAKLYDEEQYVALLQDLARADELPVGVDGDDLDALLNVLPADFPEYDESVADGVEWIECPECHHRWPK